MESVRFDKEALKNNLLDDYAKNGKPMSGISFNDLIKKVEIELSRNHKFKLAETSISD